MASGFHVALVYILQFVNSPRLYSGKYTIFEKLFLFTLDYTRCPVVGTGRPPGGELVFFKRYCCCCCNGEVITCGDGVAELLLTETDPLIGRRPLTVLGTHTAGGETGVDALDLCP